MSDAKTASNLHCQQCPDTRYQRSFACYGEFINLIRRSLSSVISRTLILLVRIYQITLSPIVGRCCRYQPTCSSYFIDAVQQHGPGSGTWMGIKRILRCHPFTRGGFDPVPTEKHEP